MIISAGSFVVLFGIVQVILGLTMIVGFYTRVSAGLLALLAVVTIILPGAILLRNVPQFALAFATAGGAIVLFIEGSGAHSLDEKLESESVAG
jgi:uncharacterized membrane protein YphA (DoxX/SURF4 family)